MTEIELKHKTTLLDSCEKALSERDVQLTELKEKNKDFEQFDDFFIEVIRMNSLYKNQKYGLAEQVRDKLSEMLDDIMRLK